MATRPMPPYPPWLLERAHVEVDIEGLKKDQNPLVLAVTARLCLEEKYQHHLKIYTDGSVMEDGAAGAAFVIPEFNNLTHSYSLPAVSIFTAELLAISMALQHISAIPVTPFAIVICSDSKAALTAIKSDSQNARGDLVREIATTTHQLITRGTEVRFQWVPAHVCLSGNEKADRAAKRGAKEVDSSTVTMKIGLADVYAELTKQAWKQWEKEFHPMATAKEWDDISPPCRAGVFFPGIPTYLARIMHRLHVGVWRCMCVPTKCECGMSVSFHHVMFSCTSCSDHFQPLTGKLRSVGLPLCTKSLAVCDQREGWSLLRAAARLVYTCPLSTGSLPVGGGTTGYVQLFPAARVNPGGGGRGERLCVSRTHLFSAGPDSSDHHKCMLAYPSNVSRLTTGLDFTTSVCELPCLSSTFLTVNTVCADCIYYMLCSPPT